MGNPEIPNPDQVFVESLTKVYVRAFGRILHHIDAGGPPKGEKAAIPNHPIFFPCLDEQALGGEMDVRAEGYHPVRKGDDIAMLYFLVHGLHHFGNILDNGGVITILCKGCKIFLGRRSIHVSGTTHGDDSVKFIHQCLVTTSICKSLNDGGSFEMGISVIATSESNYRGQVKVIMNSTSSEHINTLLRNGSLLGII